MGAGAKDIKAGGASIVIRTIDATKNGLDAAEKRLKSFGSKAIKFGISLAATGLGFGAGLVAMTESFSEAGSALDDMSQRVGDTVENLSAVGYAAKLSGSDINTLEGGLSKMSGVIAGAISGEKAATDLLDSLGLKAADLKGKLPTEQLGVFADKIAGIADQDQRADMVKAIFGKSGVQLLPLLSGGSKGIKELTDEAKRLGAVMSSEDAAAAAAFGDSLDHLQTTVGAITNRIGASLAPALTDLVDRAAGVASIVADWVDKNRGLVVILAAGTAAVIAMGLAIAGLGVVASVAGTAIGLASAAIGFLVSPVGLAIAAVVALGAVIVTQTDIGKQAVIALGDQFTELVAFARETFGAIADAIGMGRLDLAMEVAWSAIKTIWVAGVDWLKSSWDKAFIYLEAVLDRFSGSVRTIWQGISNAIAKPLAYVIAKAQGLDVNDVMKSLEDENKGQLAKINAGANARATNRQTRLNAINAGEPSEELQKANAALADAIKAVSTAKAESDAAKIEGIKKTAMPETVIKSGIAKAASVASVGAAVINSSAAASSAAKAFNGNNIARDTLNVAKEQKALLQKIADKEAIEITEYGE